MPPLAGLTLHAIPLDSKPPPYSPNRAAPQRGDNIGLRIVSASGTRVFYAPGLGSIEPHVRAELAEADVILVDGTFWTDDEMRRLGLSSKLARDMGHLAQSGPHGMIAALDETPVRWVEVGRGLPAPSAGRAAVSSRFFRDVHAAIGGGEQLRGVRVVDRKSVV